jgi:hypothetical protein
MIKKPSINSNLEESSNPTSIVHDYRGQYYLQKTNNKHTKADAGD